MTERGRQDVPQGGDLRARRSYRPSACPPRSRTRRGSRPTCPPGFIGGQQHLHCHHKRDDAEQRVRQATAGLRNGPRRCPRHAIARAGDENRQPQILLDEDQRSQPRHARTPPPLDEGNAPERPTAGRPRRPRETGHRPRPAAPTPARRRDPTRSGAAPSEEALRQARDRQDRRGDQQVLDDEKSERRGEETIDRPEQRQDRMEVIAQQVVARAP